MEKWTDSSFMKFMRGKGKVMHMGRNNSMCQHKLESSLAEEDPSVLTDTELAMSLQ